MRNFGIVLNTFIKYVAIPNVIMGVTKTTLQQTCTTVIKLKLLYWKLNCKNKLGSQNEEATKGLLDCKYELGSQNAIK